MYERKDIYFSFFEKEKELVVVIISRVSGGKAQGYDCWTMSADFLAYECEGQIFEDRKIINFISILFLKSVTV